MKVYLSELLFFFFPTFANKTKIKKKEVHDFINKINNIHNFPLRLNILYFIEFIEKL